LPAQVKLLSQLALKGRTWTCTWAWESDSYFSIHWDV